MSFIATACTALSLISGGNDSPVRVPVIVEQPAGYADNPSTLRLPLRQDLDTATIVAKGPGRYALTLGAGPAGVTHGDIDVSLLVPRIPALAKADPDLVRFAIFQREFNRNEVRFGAVDGADEFKIANNCLKQCLWEVMLDEKGEKGSAMVYHGWVPFPRDLYAVEFERINGVSLAQHEAMMSSYPRIDGMSCPLSKLRTPAGGETLAVEAFWDESPIRFGEQRRKSKLIVTTGIERYRDFIDPAKQPIAVASFQEPGAYDRAQPFTADLTWIAQPKSAIRRPTRVGAETIQEVEIEFAGGRRLLFADRRLADLPARTEPPTDDKDTLRLTFGIGTPDIYAARAERERELAEDRPTWLMLLGPDGKHVDNHTQGVDRVFVWREGGAKERLHLYLVGYERIAVVAHLAIPWRTSAL